MTHILLIDDEINALEALSLTISQNKLFTIHKAANAFDGLDYVRRQRPQIIITDIKMPQMSGLQLIEHIKKIERYQPIIYILSGYGEFEFAQKAISLGVTGYFLKPIDDDELLATLEKAVSNEEQYASTEILPPAQMTMLSESLFDKVKKYVLQHYSENIHIKTLAATFYINTAYLGRLIKKNTGKSFSVFLNDLRIHHAKILLATTSAKIYEIALAVGYNDPEYFNTKFFSAVGKTPSRYRLDCQSNH